MEIKRIYRTKSSWRMEIQSRHTVYVLTLDEAWKLALEIIQSIGAHYRRLNKETIVFLCPYCGSRPTDEDVSRDGEALKCPDCDQRVEFADAVEMTANATAPAWPHFPPCNCPGCKSVRIARQAAGGVGGDQ